MRAFKWRLSPLILEANHTPRGVFHFSNPSHNLSPSFIYSSIVIPFLLFVSCSSLVFLVSIWQFYLVSFPCSLIPHLLASFSPYNCLFLLLLWSEPSHLFNHLVKFVSSGNLLTVLTIFLLKNPNLSKVSQKKWTILKSTHITSGNLP